MDFYMVMKIAGLGILIGVIALVLEQTQRKEIAQLTILAGVVVVLIFVVQAIGDLFNLVRSVFQIY